MTRSPTQIANLLVWICDAIALAAIFGTGEVRLELLGVLIALGLGRFLVQGRISNWILFSAFVMLLVAAAFAWIRFQVPLVIALAHVLPILLGMLWLSKGQSRDRLLRLGMGFVALNLAAVVTPDVYLSASIFAYAVAASTLLSCSFLERELARAATPEVSRLRPKRERLTVDLAPELQTTNLGANVELPARYLSSSVGLSFLVLLSSLVIFPILPRPKMSPAFDLGVQNVGYTEDVRLSRQLTLQGAGRGEVLVRLFAASYEDLSKIPGGLLRARVLERFDGEGWRPQTRRFGERRETVSLKPPESAASIALEIVREPVSSDYLPVPYGSETVEVQSMRGDGEWVRPRLSRNGEAFQPGWARRRIQSRVSFRESELPWVASSEAPGPEHLELPELARQPWFQAEHSRIFDDSKSGKVTSARARVRQLQAYFRSAGFRPAEEGQRLGPGESSNKTPLEHFLTESRQGHCELFATATALLLRAAGVPTRLVTGFRVARLGRTGSGMIRSGDAHAWVEAYLPGEGWLALDFTPRIALVFDEGLLGLLRDSYDSVSNSWYRYVLRFDAESQIEGAIAASKAFSETRWREKLTRSVHAWGEQALWTGATLLGLVALGVGVWFRLRARNPRARGRSDARGPSWMLRSLGALLRLQGDRAPASAQLAYERLRFGPHPGERARALWIALIRGVLRIET